MKSEFSVWSGELTGSISAGATLNVEEAEALMGDLLSGQIADDEIAGLLKAINGRGYDRDELVGFRSGMLAVATRVEGHTDSLDIVGTGGSAHGRRSGINVSTMACFIAAAGGAKVAKHGNRKVSSTSGSFDFLEALGVPFLETPVDIDTQLSTSRLAFVFARKFHPAVAAVGPARQLLGEPSVFNVLGPLANPVQPRGLLLGANSVETAELLADVLATDPQCRAYVVFGEDGIDEISLSAPTKVFDVNAGEVLSSELRPDELGLNEHSKPATGGSPQENVAIFESMLGGEITPAAELVIANAGAGLFVAGCCESVVAGIERAKSVVEGGKLAGFYEGYKIQLGR